MLINLSNHPFGKWPAEQLQTAVEKFETVADLPFPQVDPKATTREIELLADDFAAQCIDMLVYTAHGESANAVHVMGEMTFTCMMVQKLREKGLLAVASTTERQVTTDSEGNKISVFRFVQFRPYFLI